MEEQRGAVFSPCRTYRYALWRTWDSGTPAALFVCLNPSTADESLDDPTVRRCRSFARDWGRGGVVVCNLFAYRAKDPREMARAGDPVGPDNDAWILKMAESAGLVIAAWGARGKFRDRDRTVLALRDDWRCLAVCKDGHPRHPLYSKRGGMPAPYANKTELCYN